MGPYKPDGTPRKKLDTSILENMGWKKNKFKRGYSHYI